MKLSNVPGRKYNFIKSAALAMLALTWVNADTTARFDSRIINPPKIGELEKAVEEECAAGFRLGGISVCFKTYSHKLYEEAVEFFNEHQAEQPKFYKPEIDRPDHSSLG